MLSHVADATIDFAGSILIDFRFLTPSRLGVTYGAQIILSSRFRAQCCAAFAALPLALACPWSGSKVIAVI
jgi:hypothetical protein